MCSWKGEKCPVKQMIPAGEGGARGVQWWYPGEYSDECRAYNTLRMRNSGKKVEKKIHGCHGLVVETCALRDSQESMGVACGEEV